MKRIVFLLLLPLHVLAQQVEKPKLVIGIVVDQMRYEMLNRYIDNFSDKGFNYLRGHGFSFENCNYSYIPTYTAPGHATIFTGNTPKTHGIYGNSWYVSKKNKSIYCVEDRKAKPVGTKDKECGRSSVLLKTETLADYISKNQGSKSFGISIKDRGAILPAGKKPNGAYWMDNEAFFVSSSYYTKTLPDWLIAFNAKELQKEYMQTTWNLLLNEEEYSSSDADNRPFEKTLLKDTATFPYDLQAAYESLGNDVIKSTPWGNSIVVDLALQLVINENLGQDDNTDFLSIGFSSTDYIGHDFGPNSREVQDAFMHLDNDIAKLLNFLDNQVGEGEYLIFLTSDHGVADCPTRNGVGSYVNPTEFEKYLIDFSELEFGKNIIKEISNFQVWFDHDIMEKYYLEVEDVAYLFSDKISNYQNGTAFANCFTKEDVRDCNEPECELFQNAFSEEFSGDLFFTLVEGNLLRSTKYGTSHGSGYGYDTHVPFIVFGAGVKSGSSQEKVDVTDITPTILNLLGLQLDVTFEGTSRVDLME